MTEMTCPHCGARGKILLPGPDALMLGPCPECDELLALFCGHAFALDKRVMVHGSPEEKQRHLMGILTKFLGERIGELVRKAGFAQEVMGTGDDPGDQLLDAPDIEDAPLPDRGPITHREVADFVRFELPRLDRPGDFEAIFG